MKSPFQQQRTEQPLSKETSSLLPGLCYFTFLTCLRQRIHPFFVISVAFSPSFQQSHWPFSVYAINPLQWGSKCKLAHIFPRKLLNALRTGIESFSFQCISLMQREVPLLQETISKYLNKGIY